MGIITDSLRTFSDFLNYLLEKERKEERKREKEIKKEGKKEGERGREGGRKEGREGREGRTHTHPVSDMAFKGLFLCFGEDPPI